MDEAEIQARRRDNEEKATQQRAAILGLSYLDTREIADNLPLIDGVIGVDQMHRAYIIPLHRGNEAEAFQFGITTQTPQFFLNYVSIIGLFAAISFYCAKLVPSRRSIAVEAAAQPR